MTIWADADSLPREVRRLIARRAGGGAGAGVGGAPSRAVFVANKPQPLPPGPNLFAVIVGTAASQPKPSDGSAPASGRGASADDYILSVAEPGDVLVTRDIPLASRAIDMGLVAINDRGTVWSADLVKERLSLRDHMEALRQSGLAPGSPSARSFGPKEARAFADALDKAIRTAANLRDAAL